MKTTDIKGSCEHCGFAYKGTISLGTDGAFSDIKCPNCHEETQNFDEAAIIDANDKIEHYNLDYKESVFETVESVAQ